jgi:hypothetical protein
MLKAYIPRACRNKKPRNIGDENLEPIQTQEYIDKVLKFMDDGRERKDTDDTIACFIIVETFEQLHCNKKYPENFNIYRSKKDEFYIYENDNWSKIEEERLLDIAASIRNRLVKILERED